MRDEVLVGEVRRVFEENYRVYGRTDPRIRNGTKPRTLHRWEFRNPASAAFKIAGGTPDGTS
ncbi:hypothetical protein HMPREF0578_2341 [Mobiluncus mulieris 28-1]|nr:hypothetical protein HMPREF0578_2341 [Mobiluncus mulieris 28-1]